MIVINPIELTDRWFSGFALDIHTIESSLVGYDDAGHEQFSTVRSPIGELLYKFKYQKDRSALSAIVETARGFIHSQWGNTCFQGIIPVPASTQRPFQPAVEITRHISAGLGIPHYDGILIKVKETPQLKDVSDRTTRLIILRDAFAVTNVGLIKGKRILLLDDLYRSGATLSTVCQVLNKAGLVKDIRVLTITKTRTKR